MRESLADNAVAFYSTQKWLRDTVGSCCRTINFPQCAGCFFEKVLL
jgi:hypothetical protein